MSNSLTSELEGWDEIINDAGGGNDDRRTTANVKAARKLVLSIANLQQSIFSFQKIVGPRLDTLRESIDRFNDSSTNLYKTYLLFTKVIAIATVINVILVGLSLFLRK